MSFVRGRWWKIAKSSPHSYTIKFWRPDAVEEFYEAARYIRENGEPGMWNGETFLYHRPGDGYQYWTMEEVSDAMILINRAVDRRKDQLSLFDQ